MLLFRLRRSERLKVQIFVGLLLVALTLLFPLPWWLKIVTIAAFSAIVLHLSLAWPETFAVGAGLRFGIAIMATVLIAAVVWISIGARNSNDQARSTGQAALPLPPTERGSQANLKNIGSLTTPGLESSNDRLRVETVAVVIRLREFQNKIDAWYQNADRKLNQPMQAGNRSNIEQAKELGSEMAALDREFNSELKGQILRIKESLESRIPAKSLPVNPSVDWVLQHGFANVHNGVGNIADYLETLAQRVPEK